MQSRDVAAIIFICLIVGGSVLWLAIHLIDNYAF